MRSRVIVALGSLGAVVVAIACLGELSSEVFGRLLFGWWSYLARVMPRVTVAWDSVATGVVCLVLFTLGLHGFLRWFYAEVQRASGPPDLARRRWRARWTASLVAIVILMFVAGIAATGLTHQAGWLLSSKKPLTGYRLDPKSYWLDSTNNLRQMGFGIQSGIDQFDVHPDAQGEDLRSWQTKILGFLPVIPGSELHSDLPWDDPRNSTYFKGVVLFYLNPDVVGPFRSPGGYALSHYAGNVHVLGRGHALSERDLVKGTASTIVAGEAAGRFKPWGDPTNLRDPTRGINTTIEGFGGPTGTGANILFLDGSVRFLSDKTDATLLTRLSRPGLLPAASRADAPRSGPGSQ